MKRASTAMIAALAAFGGAIATPAISASKAELVFWRSAQKSGEIEEYRAYLRQYPNGDFTELAKSRIAAAEGNVAGNAVTTAPEAEAVLSLRQRERRAIQSELTRLGYDTRGIDGVFGAGTRGAIRNWQTAAGYSSTGYLTADQTDQLLHRYGTDETVATAPVEVDETPTYISPAQARSTEAGLFLSAAEKREIQIGLRNEGFYNGGIDGVFGSGTRSSIRAWQRTEGETQTGYLDANQARSLKVIAGSEAGATVAADDASDSIDAYDRALNRNERAEVEQRLVFAGFDPGKVNGKFGDTAREAIYNYRSARGLERHQYVDQNMVNVLVNETQAEFSQKVTSDAVDPEVAAAVAAGALLVGGAILLSD